MISELARLAGIQERYTDFYGIARTVSRESIIAMLQAMGYPVATDAQAREEIERMRSAQSSLQPVYVVRAGEPVRLDVGMGDVTQPWHLVAEDGSTISGSARGAIEFPEPLASGYYVLHVDDASSTVIAAPSTAYVPPELEERRLWGVSAQLYSLRSDSNWGIGDFGDLAVLARTCSSAGAACVALNPLHELQLTNPTSASPYSPTSRLHLNSLYIDVPAASALLGGESLAWRVRPDVASLQRTDIVDYAGVARLKIDALRKLHKDFRAHRDRSPYTAEFEQFRESGGARLRRFAIYEALMDEFKRLDAATYGWMQWPVSYRNPSAPIVGEFAETHADDVEFYEFLQWLADRQLAHAARAASSMPIGLYRDLAVGVDANSADVWTDQCAFCLGLGIGAPPDPLNAAGQNWSLPPLNPRVLRERAYAPFIALLRANMRHAGALRIDHVMGLMRLFCIPKHMDAHAGTYIRYRFEEMLAVLSLESVRQQCAIVGEDLGTVPPGFRERMRRQRIFGCRLLFFEREDDGRFRAPSAYDEAAVASTGTHDLPPLAGFWSGADIAIREQLHPGNANGAAARRERALARKYLLRMLESYGDLGTNEASRLDREQDAPSDEALEELIASAYRALGRSAARLVLVQLEDVLLERHPVNTPGTFDEVPNWRRKLPVPVGALRDDCRFKMLASVMNEARMGGAR
jgi:4-alpha-glucanotransferase